MDFRFDVAIVHPGKAQFGQINGNRGTADGNSPFPSSLHPGGVNVCLCDGSARFVSESIDMTVYAYVMAPAGTRSQAYRPGQRPLGDNAF